MQPAPFSDPTSLSWITANSSNVASNNSTFWSNGGFRKRKAAVSDLDEKLNQKMFVTEEKMVKEMRTLSLNLTTFDNASNSSAPIPASPVNDEPIDESVASGMTIKDDDSSDEEKETNVQETRFELHKLLKDGWKKDDLQDNLLSKLCEIERRKLTMQIVPYMPIHPAQLSGDTVTSDEKTEEEEEKEVVESASPVISEEVKDENDDHIFKIPSTPTPYTVEEPCDGSTKRASAMKRSYSQSNQSNSSLSVTELKHDPTDPSSLKQSQSAYFIVEPSATSLSHTSSSTSNSSLSTNDLSVRITEFVDNPAASTEFDNTFEDDDIDMQSVASSDTGDKMDDD